MITIHADNFMLGRCTVFPKTQKCREYEVVQISGFPEPARFERVDVFQMADTPTETALALVVLTNTYTTRFCGVCPQIHWNGNWVLNIGEIKQ